MLNPFKVFESQTAAMVITLEYSRVLKFPSDVYDYKQPVTKYLGSGGIFCTNSFFFLILTKLFTYNDQKA